MRATVLARPAPRRDRAGGRAARRRRGPGAAGRPAHAALDGGQLRGRVRRAWRRPRSTRRSTHVDARRLAGLPAVRARIGRADAAVAAARLAVDEAARRVDEAPGDEETNRWVWRAKLLAGTTAADVAASHAGGGRHRRRPGAGHPLERLYRDARCGSLQPATSDVCADWLGVAALGGDPDRDGSAPAMVSRRARSSPASALALPAAGARRTSCGTASSPRTTPASSAALAERIFANSGVRDPAGAVNPLLEDVSGWSTERADGALPGRGAAAGQGGGRPGAGRGRAWPPTTSGCSRSAPAPATSRRGWTSCSPATWAWPPHTQRLFVGHMGCYAALPGLGAVGDFVAARGRPGAAALRRADQPARPAADRRTRSRSSRTRCSPTPRPPSCCVPASGRGTRSARSPRHRHHRPPTT